MVRSAAADSDDDDDEDEDYPPCVLNNLALQKGLTLPENLLFPGHETVGC